MVTSNTKETVIWAKKAPWKPVALTAAASNKELSKYTYSIGDRTQRH